MGTTTARRIRRAAGATLTGTLLVGGLIAGSASPASAAQPPSTSCPGFLQPPDDGPLSGIVHRNVEPLVPALTGTVHKLNCDYVESIEYVPTPGYVRDVVDTVNYAVNGPQYTLPLVGQLPKLPALLPGFKLPGGNG